MHVSRHFFGRVRSSGHCIALLGDIEIILFIIAFSITMVALVARFTFLAVVVSVASGDDDGFCHGSAESCSSVWSSNTCTDVSGVIEGCDLLLDTCDVICNFNPLCRCDFSPLGCTTIGFQVNCDGRVSCTGFGSCSSLDTRSDCLFADGCDWTDNPPPTASPTKAPTPEPTASPTKAAVADEENSDENGPVAPSDSTKTNQDNTASGSAQKISFHTIMKVLALSVTAFLFH